MNKTADKQNEIGWSVVVVVLHFNDEWLEIEHQLKMNLFEKMERKNEL